MEGSKVNRTRVASIVLAVVAIVASSVALAGNALAACGDPIATNDPHVSLDASGVEVDWGVQVRSGCSARLRVVVFRDTDTEPDVRSAQVNASPSLTYGAGTYTITGLLPASDPLYGDPTTDPPGWGVLYVDGVVYRIVDMRPADFS
jgi:hypothetical protein